MLNSTPAAEWLQREENRTFQVWRIDDNGNVFAVGEPTSEREARCQVAMYEARGHKQTYWLERAK